MRPSADQDPQGGWDSARFVAAGMVGLAPDSEAEAPGEAAEYWARWAVAFAAAR
jgi:hypothetical protein